MLYMEGYWWVHLVVMHYMEGLQVGYEGVLRNIILLVINIKELVGRPERCIMLRNGLIGNA